MLFVFCLLLAVGREVINYASVPANLLSYNISKNKLLFDLTFPYNTENIYDNFIRRKSRIYLKKGVTGVTCIDGKTGKFIWLHTIENDNNGGVQMYLFDDKLVVYSPIYAIDSGFIKALRIK